MVNYSQISTIKLLQKSCTIINSSTAILLFEELMVLQGYNYSFERERERWDIGKRE